MLSRLTQTAIAVLYDIYAGGISYRTAQTNLEPDSWNELLGKLERGGLIRRTQNSSNRLLPSYELTRPFINISLLDVLESIGEHLNCNQPAKEEMYLQYRAAASRLGVINQMTRLYLSEIKLIDL